MNSIQFLRIIHLRFIGIDCEKLITAIWGNTDGFIGHLVHKLTSYCNKYNSSNQNNCINWNGLLMFVMSLDNERIAHFNMWMQNEFNINPA